MGQEIRIVALFLTIPFLFFIPSMQAQERENTTLYFSVDDYYLQFESIASFVERVTNELLVENVNVVLQSALLPNPLSPAIIVIETNQDGSLLSIASGEYPMRGLSSILESHYGYGFTIRDVSGEEAVAAAVGFGLYVLGRCEQAISYLDEFQGYSGSDSGLGAAMTFYAGNCSLLQGNLRLAESYFRYSMQLQRHLNFPVWSNLAWTYIHLGENDRAYELFDELFAVARNGADKSFLVTLIIRRVQFYILTIRLEWEGPDMPQTLEEAHAFLAKPID